MGEFSRDEIEREYANYRAVAAQAGEFHVATGGKDSNPGTQAAPLRTIHSAMASPKPPRPPVIR